MQLGFLVFIMCLLTMIVLSSCLGSTRRFPATWLVSVVKRYVATIYSFSLGHSTNLWWPAANFGICVFTLCHRSRSLDILPDVLLMEQSTIICRVWFVIYFIYIYIYIYICIYIYERYCWICAACPYCPALIRLVLVGSEKPCSPSPIVSSKLVSLLHAVKYMQLLCPMVLFTLGERPKLEGQLSAWVLLVNYMLLSFFIVTMAHDQKDNELWVLIGTCCSYCCPV